MESPDVDITAMSKNSPCCEWAERSKMLVTGALRGAGRNSISGSRARSAIGGEAEAHKPYAKNVPLG